MIRQFRSEDAGPCSELMRACIDRDPSLPPDAQAAVSRGASPESLLESARHFYLAVFDPDELPLGVAGLQLNEIRLLFVHPEHQRGGIGTLLLEHLESLVPAELFPEIFVYCAPGAEAFYRMRGYRPHGKHDFDVGGVILPTVFMKKGLR